jgi:hypothetical protein
MEEMTKAHQEALEFDRVPSIFSDAVGNELPLF